MKILHVINSLVTAGAERLVVDMAIEMRRAGHETAVLVFNDRRTAFYEQLEESGVSVYAVGANEYNPIVILRLRDYLRQYDVVHVHLFPAQYWIAVASALYGRYAALVTTEHSTWNSRCKYKLTTWLDRCMYKRYDAISCISPATLAFVQKRVRGKVQSELIENGIDVQRFQKACGNRSQLLPDIPQDAFVLMQVARFREAKNQDCVIRALQQLPEDVYAVFAGDGEREAVCRELAVALSVEKRVRFLGARADVPELLSVADAVVMSSHWEGFGLSSIEGMAAGKPVLAADVEGLAQVVSNPELLFISNDAGALAKKVLSLRDFCAYRQEMGAWCQERSRKFDISHTVEQYIFFYQRAIKSIEKR